MPYALVPIVGVGPSRYLPGQQQKQPLGLDEGGNAYRLGRTRALIWTPETIRHAAAVTLADHKQDTLSPRLRRVLQELTVGDRTYDRRLRLDEILKDLLLRPTGWNPLQPMRDGVLQVWLGPPEDRILSFGRMAPKGPHSKNVQDTFERGAADLNGSATSDAQTTWVEDQGTGWETDGDEADITDSVGFCVARLALSMDTGDHYAQADLSRWLRTTGYLAAGVIVRAQGAASPAEGYGFEVGNVSGLIRRVYDLVDDTTIVSDAIETTSGLLHLEFNGSNYVAKVAGSTIFSGSDSQYAGTYKCVGITGYSDTVGQSFGFASFRGADLGGGDIITTPRDSGSGTSVSSKITSHLSLTVGSVFYCTVSQVDAVNYPPQIPTISGWQLVTSHYGGGLWERISLLRKVGDGSIGTLTIDFAGQTQTQMYYAIAEVTGLNLTTPEVSGSAKTNLGATASATLTFNAAASSKNAHLFAAVSGYSTITNTPEGGWIPIAEQDGGYANYSFIWRLGGGDSTPSVDYDTSTDWLCCGVELNASDGMDLAIQIATLVSATDAASQNFSAASITAGRVILACAHVCHITAPTGLSISDDLGHTWIKELDVASWGDGVISGRFAVWRTVAKQMGTMTATVTALTNNGVRWAGAMVEIKGAGTIITQSKAGSNTTGETASAVYDASPAGAAQSIVFGALGDSAITRDAAYTEISEVVSNGGSNNIRTYAQAKNGGAGTGFEFTWTGNLGWNIYGAEIRAPGVVRVGPILELGLLDNDGSTSIEVPADATAIVVGLSGFVGGGACFIGVTLNGVPLTKMTPEFDDDTNYFKGAVFYLANPATGSQTLAWDFSGALENDAVALIAFYTGANTSRLVRDSDGLQGLDGPFTSKTLTALPGDLIIAFGEAYMTGGSPSFSWTNANKITAHSSVVNESRLGYAEVAPSGNQTVACHETVGDADGGLGVLVLRGNSIIEIGPRNETGTNPLTCILTAPREAGDLIAVMITQQSDGSVTAISDSDGNTGYVSSGAGVALNEADTQTVEIWYCSNCVAHTGTNTITITTGGPNYRGAHAFLISGRALSGVTDGTVKTHVDYQGSATPATAGTLTPDEDNEVVVGMMATEAPPYTLIDGLTLGRRGVEYWDETFYAEQGVKAPQNWGYTAPSTGSWGIVVVGFKKAAGGSGATVTLTGTITSNTNETDIRTGGKIIVLTLTGEAWIN